MRRTGVALFALMPLVAAGSGSADADPAGHKPPSRRDEMDLSKIKPDLVLLHDGRGHYLATAPFAGGEWTFYGDGKVFHQLRVYSFSSDQGAGNSSRRFWSPISTDADLILKGGNSWEVHCSDRVTPVVAVGDAERAEILGRATFKRPFWTRQSHALARDDRGVYYYVDKLRDDRSATEREKDPNPPRGYRLHVGKKGRMKLQRLSDAVDDSKGLVLSTRKADLSIDFEAKKVVWTVGRRRTELTFLPTDQNPLLIYRDLGLYKRLGVPCDDM